jgi:predicted house-cleaning noncanonical NTP pyrophosphatase (MazG superfamily)
VGTINYQKLVRDKIPDIITADGEVPHTRVLDEKEYRQKLLEKLVEEANELLESNGDLGERADIAEVLKALDRDLGFDSTMIEEARSHKAEKRGGFEQRIFLERADTRD